MLERDFKNPFANYGKIVCGERFIDRSDGIKVIENRIIRPKEPGNLAIIGTHRIGKSSLVYHSIMTRKNELSGKKRIPIWINLATFDQPSIFFRALVTSSYNEIKSLGLLSNKIYEAANATQIDNVLCNEAYQYIQRFFETVRQDGINILFILDEFDHARYLFKENISDFQRLRELSYRPECGVTLITTSRRTLRNIESQTKSISTLELTFQNYYLSMFDEPELEEYFARLSSVGINLTPGIREAVMFYCGGHPYLLEMLGYEIVELFRETNAVDISQAAQRIEQSFIHYYEHMLDVLREDKSLNKILQILFGPIVDANLTDVEELKRYGIIKTINKENYSAFSEHFQTYLKMIGREIDLWPLWRDTEIALRRVIMKKMIGQYGEQWVQKLCMARPNLKPIFDKCKEAQQKEERSFGIRASKNLLDFAYPIDLFDIMFVEWGTFRNVLGKDKNYWGQRAQLLSKMRNPLAHNRYSSLDDYERQTAEAYCKEILATLEKDKD